MSQPQKRSDDDAEIIERIRRLSHAYATQTGRYPTHLVLTEGDLFELDLWIRSTADRLLYCGVDEYSQPTIFHMLFKSQPYITESYVFFAES